MTLSRGGAVMKLSICKYIHARGFKQFQGWDDSKFNNEKTAWKRLGWFDRIVKKRGKNIHIDIEEYERFINDTAENQ